MKWYLKAFRNYFKFKGRARRKEYWMFMLFNVVLASVAAVLDSALLGTVSKNLGFGLLSSLYALVALMPELAVTVRRLHDVGKSGWWLFITLVPFIGSIWLLVLLASDGQPGENKYGPNPASRLTGAGGRRKSRAALLTSLVLLALGLGLSSPLLARQARRLATTILAPASENLAPGPSPTPTPTPALAAPGSIILVPPEERQPAWHELLDPSALKEGFEEWLRALKEKFGALLPTLTLIIHSKLEVKTI